METHVRVVAVLHLVFGVLGFVVGGIVGLMILGGGVLSGESEAMTITAVVGSVIVFVTLILSLPGILGGIGLLNRQNWARILVLVLSILNLFNFPIGTALGGYSLWALLHPDCRQYFA